MCRLGYVVLVLLLAWAACGDSGGSSGVCKEACEAKDAAECLPIYTLEQCTTNCDGFGVLPSACRNAVEEMFRCELRQPDICDAVALSQACQAEYTAFASACDLG